MLLRNTRNSIENIPITINGSDTICGTLIPFEQASNEIIVNNIYSQLLYLYR